MNYEGYAVGGCDDVWGFGWEARAMANALAAAVPL
jgi:hypothetical protein